MHESLSGDAGSLSPNGKDAGSNRPSQIQSDGVGADGLVSGNSEGSFRAVKAQQGHRYKLDEQVDVLALEGGDMVRVAFIDKNSLTGFLPLSQRVSSDRLTPQPMKYFSGQVPA